jgi:hypothetical protein
MIIVGRREESVESKKQAKNRKNSNILGINVAIPDSSID